MNEENDCSATGSMLEQYKGNSNDTTGSDADYLLGELLCDGTLFTGETTETVLGVTCRRMAWRDIMVAYPRKWIIMTNYIDYKDKKSEDDFVATVLGVYDRKDARKCEADEIYFMDSDILLYTRYAGSLGEVI